MAEYVMPPNQWAAFRDGEILFSGAGPDVEAMARAAVGNGDADRIAYREPVRPTAENGWALNGPWIDAEE